MVKTSFDEIDESGEFKRQPTSFRGTVKADGSSEFPAASGRYHLYVSYACPWASRCLAFLALKGLEDVIPVHYVKPRWDVAEGGAKSWVFETDGSLTLGVDCSDPLNGCSSLLGLYRVSQEGYSGKTTVPLLWDSETSKIVNNESSEIIIMFNDEFNEFAAHPKVDLRPKEYLDEIERLSDWIYNPINNGVYRCGFAQSQAAYEKAYHELFSTLDEVEDLLSKQRFLAGTPEPTEADIRLFVTIVRFDPVYFTHFKCNKRRLISYPNVYEWCRDIYQHRNIASTVHIPHIKEHYFGSHPLINPFGIVPLGPEDVDYSLPHGRADKF